MSTYPLQQTCLGVIYGTPLLAALFVILRVYTRRKLNLRLSWDDWLVIAALILSIALIGPSHKHVKMWHVGIHIWDIPPREIEPDYDEYHIVAIAENLLIIPILPLVKASIICLLMRAGSVIPWLKKILYAMLIFTVGSSLIPWFLYIFICPPQTGNTWKPRTFGNLGCMDRHMTGHMLIWVTCANLVTDLLIFPIPFIIVRRMMSARWRSQLLVLSVFTCSLAVTGIGAAKIYLTYRDRLYSVYKPDWTYPIDYCINHIESNVAIIVANIPILRGLVTRWTLNFRPKSSPMQRVIRSDRHWKGASHVSSVSQPGKRRSMVKKIFPWVRHDFSSSLATRSGGTGAEHSPNKPKVLAGTITAETRINWAYNPIKAQKDNADQYEMASSCEKGDGCETIRNATSIGSASTLTGSRVVSWKNLDSPPVSPKIPCPVRLRGREIDDDDDEMCLNP
ncbi:hypothetical protein P153DRAFT_374699 [Dothidotthia symphoricarpi CBS 119687]|uniref:Rhodopsin domain-containing protein n=1 Tax=Dothidotthia symphoricarpi CBS 119687 TaxID=1392245 RepID=A0A6A6AHX6_9PLEO|nr:uncharacterized protein P153DRAFT_374699 [Dothidotthia symphoricarpi CBS 119687]KAF2130853.1 hypothetical protein P153DRAFT_374699 [Dothidotthia symphoricarpi CBS 119687]